MPRRPGIGGHDRRIEAARAGVNACRRPGASRVRSTRRAPKALDRKQAGKLVEALEEELSQRVSGFRIDDEDLEDLRTVRDAVDYVVAKLGEG